MQRAAELAGGRVVAIAAGDVGGQALAEGLVDEVAMDVVPVVFGFGRRYFGTVDTQHLLEDPDVIVQGDRACTCATGYAGSAGAVGVTRRTAGRDSHATAGTATAPGGDRGVRRSARRRRPRGDPGARRSRSSVTAWTTSTM